MSAIVQGEEVLPAAATTSRNRRWFFLAIVTALIAAVAFGGGFYVGDEAPAAPEGMASAELVAVIDGTLAAFNSGNMKKFGSYFTENAIFEEPGPSAKPVQGRDEIIRIMQALYDLGAQYNRIGDVVYTDGIASYPVSGPGGTEMDVALFNDDLKIEHYWVILQ